MSVVCVACVVCMCVVSVVCVACVVCTVYVCSVCSVCSVCMYQVLSRGRPAGRQVGSHKRLRFLRFLELKLKLRLLKLRGKWFGGGVATRPL